MSNEQGITIWEENDIETDEAWEAAYKAFESPQEEIQKFKTRLRRLDAGEWPRDARIVELFCGRCNGITALQELGFTSLEGVDMSLSLLQEYSGSARLYCGDCRNIQFKDSSKDIILVQGGLHHLPLLPEDLARVFSEVQRILQPGGRFVFVEPWNTPFLRAAHWACACDFLTARWGKLKALHDMIEGEKTTYYNWLNSKGIIEKMLKKYFVQEKQSIRLGKISFSGYANDML